MKSRLIGALACAMLALGLLPLAAGSAQAVGVGDPRIVAPVNAQAVPQGWTGPVRVDFSDAEVGSYVVSVECPPGEGEPELADYFFTTTYVYDGTQDDYSTTIDPIHTPGVSRCEVGVVGQGLGADYRGFVAEATTLTLTHVNATPSVFYPLVRDGDEDYTTVGYTVGRTAGMRARIRNSSGNTVRYANLGRRLGQNFWDWHGYRNNGALAAPGRYTIEVIASDAEQGTVRRVTVPVRIATTVTTRRGTSTLSGDAVTGSSRSGPCTLTRDFTARETALACNGGGFVQSWYRFVLPATASRVSATVAGRAGGTTGTITRQLQKIADRTYRAGLRVTDSRSFTVTRVSVAYDYRQRR